MALFAFLFNLWGSTIAVAAAAVSIPIIIHLLNRRRYKIVDWAAMRFLLAAQKQTTRKIRLEQIILLVCRCLLLLLLVLAMASVMPWAEDLWAWWNPEGSVRKTRPEGRVHHILVLDGSLSMNQAVAGAPAFKKAVDQAIAAVNKGNNGDGYSVLVMKDNPSWLVPKPSPVASRVIRQLEEATCSHGNASLASALNMVNSKIQENTKRYGTQVVYFFTDLQKASWQSAIEQDKDAPKEVPKDKADVDPEKEKDNILLQIQSEAQFVLIDCGKEKAANCAVVDLYLRNPLITTGQTLEIVATLQNFGGKAQEADVELKVAHPREASEGGPLPFQVVPREKAEARPMLEPGRRVERVFNYRFDKPGTYVLQVRAKGKDEDKLDQDNERHLVITVKEKVPILLVVGVPPELERMKLDERDKRAIRETYMDQVAGTLRDVLNPSPDEDRPWTRLIPDVITQRDFARMKRQDLFNYESVFLIDIGGPTEEEVELLDSFLRRGKGVVVSLGEHSTRELKKINDMLYKAGDGILPARLEKKIASPEHHFFSMDAEEKDFAVPPLRAFSDSKDKIGIASRPFKSYLQAAVNGDRVRTVLFFARELDPSAKDKLDPAVPTGDPALLEWNPLMPGGGGRAIAYPGKVVLFTSTFHEKFGKYPFPVFDGWNYWAGSMNYGAMMQEMVRLTVPVRLIGQAALVSEPLEAILPGPGETVKGTIHFPENAGGKDKKVEARNLLLPAREEVLDFRFPETDFAGVYRLILAGERYQVPFAVNVPTITGDKKGSECDLTRLDEKGLRMLYPGWNFDLHEDVSAVTVRPGPRAGGEITEKADQGPEIAKVLLIIMLILLFLETILAWQFGHYSKVEGATPPAPMGAGWPLAIAIVAAILFFAGAFVIIHMHQTNDFLSFLPDRFRTWFEVKVFNLEPPPPGETSRWTPETHPWLPPFLERNWFPMFLTIAALLTIFFVYRMEGPTVSPWFKALLGGLRFFLVMMLLYLFLPRTGLSIDRLGMPEYIVLIDDSLSMGVPDNFQDKETRDKAKKLYEGIRTRLKETLPNRVADLKGHLVELDKRATIDPKAKADAEDLRQRVTLMEAQLTALNSTTGGWRPTRLSLAQAVMLDPERDWLKHFVQKQRAKVHIFHLDVLGKITKLTETEVQADGTVKEIVVGDLGDSLDNAALERAKKAVANLEPHSKDSQLGYSLREIINQYRGSALAGIIMVTDGVTTRDETIKDVTEHARRAAAPLYFLGIGDDHDIQNIELTDLKVDDVIYLGDRAVFAAKIVAKGYKDLEVPIVLKLKDKDGREKEVDRIKTRVDPKGKPVSFKLKHTPTEVGKKHYIIEAEVTRPDKAKGPTSSRLRLERTIEVVETSQIKVLYVEGQPRYEFRFLRDMLDREAPVKGDKKSIILQSLVLDADPAWHRSFGPQKIKFGDKTIEMPRVLNDFPNVEELSDFDVIILGDVDPRHPKLGDGRLKMIADHVRGDETKVKRKTSKKGAGLLFIAGPFNNPHAYRDTPLGPLLPIEPVGAKPPPEPEVRVDKLRLDWTELGFRSNLYKLVPDETETASIWKRLQPMYWWSTGYEARKGTDTLAEHPAAKGGAKHPLIVQHMVGGGRAMFFGFDETWRWRWREDDVHYNQFWVQTMRYMARVRQNRTELRLDRQTPYKDGDSIKVTVTFPESMPEFSGPDKGGEKKKVVVHGLHTPLGKETKDGKAAAKPEEFEMALAKVGESLGTYEAVLPRVRAGKYNFWLYTPDVRKTQPDKEQPSAEALVELPPQELEDLRLNRAELVHAADKTRGAFYTLGTVDRFLDELPEPERPNLGSSMTKQRIWNHWLCFSLAVLLFSGEWILRKKKHLL